MPASHVEQVSDAKWSLGALLFLFIMYLETCSRKTRPISSRHVLQFYFFSTLFIQSQTGHLPFTFCSVAVVVSKRKVAGCEKTQHGDVSVEDWK